MTQPQIDDSMKRNAILNLLSDAENAKVSSAEGPPTLADGDEYVDLENLHEGVQRAGESSGLPTGHLLPRSAVGNATWAKIVAELGY